MAGKANAAPTRTSRVKHKTITALVANEIRELIISGEIKGGDPLRQEMLADQFGCSFIPVREALLSLQGEGLVEFIPHKGAVARENTFGEVDEIFALRALLECDILARALPHLTDRDFAAAEAVLGQFEKLLEPGTDLQRWSKLNWAFHRALYEPARRPYAFQMIQRLHTNCDRYIMLQIKLDERRSRAHAEHVEILSRVRKNDTRGATKALREHILITGKKLIDSLSAMGFFDER